MKKMLFLINPVSGKSALRSQLFDIIDVFTKAEYDVTTVITQSVEHLIHTIKERGEDFDIIVCCGGDGTASIAIGSACCLNKKPIIGYIPSGTSNDFGKMRDIPTNPLDAAKRIVKGDVHSIDVGYLGEKSYVYVAAFGVFTEVSYATPRQLKKNIGYAAYFFEAIKSISKASNYHIKFDVDGEMIEGDFILGMFSNTHRVGGMRLSLIKNFLIDDGYIDITLVRKPKTLEERTKLLNAIVSDQVDNKIIVQRRAKRIAFECDKEIPWTLDGEFGGVVTSSVFEIKHKIIDMIY